MTFFGFLPGWLPVLSVVKTKKATKGTFPTEGNNADLRGLGCYLFFYFAVLPSCEIAPAVRASALWLWFMRIRL